MFFFKKKENLFVDILDLKVDCSEIINIKEAKLVYVNGKGNLLLKQENLGILIGKHLLK